MGIFEDIYRKNRDVVKTSGQTDRVYDFMILEDVGVRYREYIEETILSVTSVGDNRF